MLMMGGTSSMIRVLGFTGSLLLGSAMREKTADDAVMLRRDQSQAGHCGASGDVFQNKSVGVQSHFIVGLPIIGYWINHPISQLFDRREKMPILIVSSNSLFCQIKYINFTIPFDKLISI